MLHHIHLYLASFKKLGFKNVITVKIQNLGLCAVPGRVPFPPCDYMLFIAQQQPETYSEQGSSVTRAVRGKRQSMS